MKSVLILLALTTSLFQATILSQVTVETWTFDDLSKALAKCYDDKCVNHPDLADAFNQIMYSMYTGEHIENILGALPSPRGTDSWTMEEISKALDNDTIDIKTRDSLNSARDRLNYFKNITDTFPILEPAVDISTWTLKDLSEALNNTSTSAKLITYLLPAYTKLNEEEASQKNNETTYVITPVGLVKGAMGTIKLLPLNESFIELIFKQSNL